MYNISRELILLESERALAFVNPSPVLPGHCISMPRRQVPQLEDLTPEESNGLWQSVQSISRALKSYYSAPALTVELKSSMPAGLYINIIPRHAGDLEQNDRIYPMLEAMVVASENNELVEHARNLRQIIST